MAHLLACPPGPDVQTACRMRSLWKIISGDTPAACLKRVPFHTPPNPVSMKAKVIVTRPSLQALADKHDHHAAQKRSAQREARVAKEWGDLSENAEYKASKEKFRLAGRLQQRLVRELKSLEDSGYEIVDPLDWTRVHSAPEIARVGVVVRVTQNRFTEDYLLVGAKDQNLADDLALVPVPYTSPLGQALFERSAPSHADALIAGEKRSLQILSLRAPTREEVLALYPELTPQDAQPPHA